MLLHPTPSSNKKTIKPSPCFPNPATFATARAQPQCPCTDLTNLGEEMGIGQEELLQKVQQGEDSSQLVAQPRLLTGFAPGPLIYTGRTGLRGSFGRQQLLQPFWASGYQLPRPVSCAEERAAGQHDIGKHPYAEELRVHAVKVGHEEEADGSRDVKEEQEAS